MCVLLSRTRAAIHSQMTYETRKLRHEFVDYTFAIMAAIKTLAVPFKDNVTNIEAYLEDKQIRLAKEHGDPEIIDDFKYELRRAFKVFELEAQMLDWMENKVFQKDSGNPCSLSHEEAEAKARDYLNELYNNSALFADEIDEDDPMLSFSREKKIEIANSIFIF